jgi:hypothetical protein
MNHILNHTLNHILTHLQDHILNYRTLNSEPETDATGFCGALSEHPATSEPRMARGCCPRTVPDLTPEPEKTTSPESRSARFHRGEYL